MKRPIGRKARALLALMRVDRPVGTLLLLWPTLAALWLAAQGMPPLGVLVLFIVGTFLARSAGCVVNDIADRRFDPHVERTRQRPLAAGEVSVGEAVGLLAALCAACVAVALFLNPLARSLALVGALIAATYPFLKRWTHLPQAGLGLAFSWGIPMAFAAVTGEVGGTAWLLFAASWAWIVGYDTIYAMVDRDDDVRIGVKSTAVLLGRADRAAVGVLQVTFLAILVAVGALLGIGVAFYIGLAAAAALFVRQQMLIRGRERTACMAAFGSNVWVGFALFAGTVAAYLAPR